MLFYVLKRLGLLRNPEEESPRTQHIIAVNKKEVQSALDYTNNTQGAGQRLEVELAEGN